MRYRVTFPGPVGKVDAGIAATLVYVEATDSDPTGETQLADRVLAYLKGIEVLDPRSRTVEPSVSLMADGSAGTGVLRRGIKRIGTFQLERLGEPDAGAKQS